MFDIEIQDEKERDGNKNKPGVDVGSGAGDSIGGKLDELNEILPERSLVQRNDKFDRREKRYNHVTITILCVIFMMVVLFKELTSSHPEDRKVLSVNYH